VTVEDPDPKELVRRHWNGRAPTFDDEPQHGIHNEAQRERWLSVLATWTPETPCRTVDLGCGTGVLSLLLAARGHEVLGVDVAPAMLAQARAKAADRGAPVRLCRGDAERLPLGADSVDLVTARHLVWTLPDPERALAEWQRVLRPGGRVVCFEGYWDHDEPWDEYAVVHDDLPLYDGSRPADLASHLRTAGFGDVSHATLDDPVLWGREPESEYYVIAGTASN
jgi:ubiquinone/menaquinone biosynthesis C-methylase UbiE